MTTYTTINNSEIDTDSPITESLLTRLRDNPLAQAEGATGAPKIANAAFSDNTIAAARLQDGSVTLATQLSKPNTTGSITITTTATLLGNGLFNIRLTHSGGGTAYFEIYVNGSWNILQSSSGTPVYFQVISDGTNVRYRTNTGTGGFNYVKLFG